ncbi:hypothetical protein GCM10017566_30850 [Amycolatopsis bartoniae]|uniref:Uncharacterized protein n=1 Tax=Amycolatopsis bartoniae TaxID=941986 RepID=A0A8H9IX58_9PSEU|nr:hypothetical protein GCM10017566_30850 [Amycolatopsis bartoniae]
MSGAAFASAEAEKVGWNVIRPLLPVHLASWLCVGVSDGEVHSAGGCGALISLASLAAKLLVASVLEEL